MAGCQSGQLQKMVDEPVMAKIAPTPISKPIPPGATNTATKKNSLDEIKMMIETSSCTKYSWKNNRGLAPKQYMIGVGLTFARSVCQQTRESVKAVSAARNQPESVYDRTDVLSWYNSNYEAFGISNDKDGLIPLRSTYTILIGLGMMESSGKYCCGRDMSANFSSSNSAEAGLFQTSWGVHIVSPALSSLYEEYKSGKRSCMLEDFGGSKVKCSEENLKTWGEGTGADWQELTKKCPAFAVEYAAIVLRKSGGNKGEFGPLYKKKAELRQECEFMLKDISDKVEEEPQLCELLTK